MPRVVVIKGLRRSTGTSTNPEAAAISIAAVRPSPSRPNRAVSGSPRGPVTRRLPVGAACRGHECVDRALAPVGHRYAVDRGAGRRPDHAAHHGFRGLRSSQAPLELVRGDHHPHRCRANPDAGTRNPHANRAFAWTRRSGRALDHRHVPARIIDPRAPSNCCRQQDAQNTQAAPAS